MDATIVCPGDFEQKNHFYQKVLNAEVHPVVRNFLNMSNERIISRYCHLHPNVERAELERLMSYRPKHMHWAGTDLFCVATPHGNRRMVVIETNSSPSGQKSMPLLDDQKEHGGYYSLLNDSFFPCLAQADTPTGALAILYDKNMMEASGYAATMAEISGEEVYLVPFFQHDTDPPVRFDDGVLMVRHAERWHPIRGALRYVTQSPWNRIPIDTKTFIYNSVIVCLAGGRNKLVASIAYEMFNSSDLAETGLQVLTPLTKHDIFKRQVPFWVRSLGGHAVVKVPYSNAGQGVYTITTEEELKAFMEYDHKYDLFIIQSLIGNSTWTSNSPHGTFFHIGTVPNKREEIYVADVRMMLCATESGYRPVALYARRTRTPLTQQPPKDTESWGMLGTNLSIKTGEDQWETDTDRLLIMDKKDFNVLGIGIDDLIEGFVQTLLAAIAIDKMATKLVKDDGCFDRDLFRSFDNDAVLHREILNRTKKVVTGKD